MNKHSVITHSILYFVLLFGFLFISCSEQEFHATRNLDFNTGWRFLEDSLTGAESLDFDDANWRTVDLPHDWSIEDPPSKHPDDIGPFIRSLPGGVDVGYLRGGTGWYRKEFVIPQQHKGREVILHFDGVMGETKVWVNGKTVGEHVYGYTPFYFNITDHVNDAGTANVVAIRVYKPNENSRWFTGAGIYRSVEISYVHPVHIAVWGVSVESKLREDNNAEVDIKISLENAVQINRNNQLHVEIISPDGNMQFLQAEEPIEPVQDLESITFSTTIHDPILWDPENPALYVARVRLYEDGEPVDEYAQSFGIREIEYSAEKGFLLNGENILLKGACLHHDNGLLGARAFQQAEERKVRIMKENGYNAIRTSHNPPSTYFLEACDRLGMLVIDEAFDAWIKPKRKNDYHQYFEQWWKSDLESMVLRDRNHPSIIMWSFGNEVQERADPSGVAIGQNCIDVIRALDNQRPITQAVCGFWDNPGKVWDDSAPAFQILDISGYNYQWANYKPDHKKYPERIMYGSESVPKEAYENWSLVKELPYVIGDFVWTGMDYIGESGIGHSTYPEPDEERRGLMPWPIYVSWCGDIDLIGNKKPQSYYRDVLWEESDMEMLVHEPPPPNNPERTSFWGWPNELPHWNWAGHEGEPLEISVLTSYDQLKLYLNEKVIGSVSIDNSNKLRARFTVPYEPGELKALAFVNGQEMVSKILHTTGQASQIQLIPEQDSVSANRTSIAFVKVQALDADGRLVPTSNVALEVTVEGEAELIAAGNANPEIEGSFVDHEFSLFRGQGLIVVQSSGSAGDIRITATSPTLKGDSVQIVAAI